MSRENNSNQLKMQNERYAQGYLPKIAYHMFKGNDEKINYFVKRQEDTYGPITPTQISEVEDMVDGLHADEAVLRAADARGVDKEGQVFGINELYI
jgi:hypothetical protein